jgi:hypothetical protein
MVDTLLNRWSADDPVAAAKWVSSLPADKQTEANAMILAVWGAADPASASAWLATFPPGETRERAIPTLAEAWSGFNPQAAITWSLSLPDSPEKSQALDQSVRIWSRNERDSLKTWIQSQPPGPASDHLRATASTVIAEQQPREAATMAAAIMDPALKQDALVDVVRQWRKADPNAADTWLSQKQLDTATLNRLQP